MKKHVYREGDKVRIVRSRFVKRVGYALHPHDLRDEMEADPRFKEALKALGYDKLNHGRAWRKLLDAVCFAEVAVRGMGGKERQIIHYENANQGDIIVLGGDWWPDYAGSIATVEGKRCVQTGTYYAPWGGRSYEGEWDYEPGGLENMKTHVLLKTVYGEIEACDVEPLAPK